ncbi:hypothetical protein ABER75_11155 [Niallia taxi]|uniref:hypothetical protein n=1 Tax=Niallia taxi TaxID=2499688 RepID=UPI00203BF99C|nr:hypothetical protein [Niallia taxi]MCM3216666.1 hypothetical protein [Niallia taxi]
MEIIIDVKKRFFQISILVLALASFTPTISAKEYENEEVYNDKNLTGETTTVEEIDDTPIDQIINPVELNSEEKENLEQLGFTEDEIETISQEEYNKYNKLDGELLTTDESVYKIISDSKGNILTTTQVTEAQAFSEMNKPAQISIRATSTKQSSWLKMTTTSSKLSNGNILLKNSFKWLKNPAIALTDVVGISHSASAVKVPGTEGFSYKYTDGVGTHSLGAKSTTRNDYGIAKKFNLKAIGTNDAPKNHNGYISIQVKKGNKNDIRANAYGHYTHITVGITGTISIKTGDISVGGNLTKSEMDDTMILFNY